MLTTFNDVDMSAVIDARGRYKDLFEKKHGIRLGFMGFFVKACALAARDVPRSTPASRARRSFVTITSTSRSRCRAPKGLVVPVIRNAKAMSFAHRPKGDRRLMARRAKDGTLTLDEMTGGTFTISNGGVFGSLLSTPIINTAWAVLGMHRIEERP